jgi:death on curing protein
VKRLRWLSAAAITAIHEELIARYGGVSGLRAASLLESALARPKHLATYKRGVTVPELAAAYSWRLLRNRPFGDGNKRIALAVMAVFLELNGWELICSEVEETAMVLQAAAGDVRERAWTTCLRGCVRKKT